MSKLIILGNGFDIACGLKTEYKHFFKIRFAKVFNVDVDDFNAMQSIRNQIVSKMHRDASNITDSDFNFDDVREFDYFLSIKSNLTEISGDVTRWDLFFLFADQYISKSSNELQWQDVESVIYEVISITLIGDGNYKSKIEYAKYKDEFVSIVKALSYVGNGTDKEVANELFNQLLEFEKIFSTYIKEQINPNNLIIEKENTPYLVKSEKLLKELIETRNHGTKLPSSFINGMFISFNYTLNDYLFHSMFDLEFKPEKLRWSNVHGIAKLMDTSFDDDLINGEPTPIFGVDSHDIGEFENDLRLLFTKQYRITLENVSSKLFNVDNKYFQDLNEIKIFGHSLGRADYSYFEAIFDECNLYGSNTKLTYYYYYPKNGQAEIKREAVSKVISLLNDYGKSLNDNHGDNLVTKMNLEKRISVIPTSNLSVISDDGYVKD